MVEESATWFQCWKLVAADSNRCESESHSVTLRCPTLRPRGLYSARFLCPQYSPGQNTGMDSLSLLQGNLPDPGSELGSAELQEDSLPAEFKWMVNFYFISTFFFKISHTLKISSAQFSRSVMSDSLQPHEPQHSRPPCPSPTPGVHPNPSPSSWWCHPPISSSVVPFSSCITFTKLNFLVPRILGFSDGI